MEIRIANNSGVPSYNCRKGCGECCIIYPNISLYPPEVMELSLQIGLPPEQFVVYNHPSRAAYLLRRAAKDGSEQRPCLFLDGSLDCGIYEHQPVLCRTFPLEIEIEINSDVDVSVSRLPHVQQCIGEERRMSEQEIIDIARKRILFMATDKITSPYHYTTGEYLSRSHETFSSMTLERALEILFQAERNRPIVVP